jgi:bacterial translation initiation factor 3 (bIF-3)
MVGVVSIEEALSRARTAGLDLIEVSPNAEPPVCKILDHGKYKFQEQKRLAEARKKQNVIEVKELKIRPTTEEHDYQVKLKAARRFIDEGNKVKFSMRFRGREITHQDIGRKQMERIIEDLGDKAKVELRPKMEGRQMLMIIVPAK